jgi:hypothetical protein
VRKTAEVVAASSVISGIACTLEAAEFGLTSRAVAMRMLWDCFEFGPDRRGVLACNVGR